MTIWHWLTDPFLDYAFMRRALAACLILSISGTPLGVFMGLRRMTLVGDAVSHAILPGVALAFLFAGLNIWALTLGGLATGVLIALSAVGLSRYTQLKEDASFTLVYLLSLATGIILISLRGTSVDVLHILFGNILGVDNNALLLIAGTAIVTIISLAVIFRGLVIDCLDPEYLRALSKRAGLVGAVFFLLLVINLVAAFQALGTLMALGLIILPAISARFWSRNLDTILPLCIGLAMVASYAGLLLSYYAELPAGPAVVLTMGLIGLGSAVLGRFGSIRKRWF